MSSNALMCDMADDWQNSAPSNRQWHAAWAWERIRRQAQSLYRTIVRRLYARREALALVAVVVFALFIFSDLRFEAALMAGIAGAAAAAARPTEGIDVGSLHTAGASGTPGGAGGGGRERSEGWRALIEAIPDAAVALSADGFVLHFNGLLKELFPRVAHGMPITHVTRNPELIAAVDRALAYGDSVNVELIERVPIERRLTVMVSRLQHSNLTPDLPVLLVTLRDQTEQDALAHMRADFIANASHELRTPLAALRGFVETLQGPARDDPKARERFLGLMQSQATRMTRLIDDLLTLSRVEMRAHLAPKGIVDLCEVTNHVVQTVEPLALATNATIVVDKKVENARIRGERDEIVQVLLNLVQNAIKYGREGGKIQISITRGGAQAGRPSQIVLEVKDNGPGIAPEHLPRLTERFYRVSAGSSRDKGGTGLGLAIVKHIVNRHRGELKIASQVGEGSTFTVAFDRV